jgi:hypothetical protein
MQSGDSDDNGKPKEISTIHLLIPIAPVISRKHDLCHECEMSPGGECPMIRIADFFEGNQPRGGGGSGG